MKRTSNIVFSLTGIFISERFRFLSILQFPKKNLVFVAIGDCTALSNRNSLRDDSVPSPLHSPQGQKSPFWITPQERRPFPHPIPENPKAKCFPNRFWIFNSPFHFAVPPSNVLSLHLSQRFAVGTRPSSAWILGTSSIKKLLFVI